MSRKLKYGKLNQMKYKSSYDVKNLYASISIDKAIDVILQQLSEDYKDLKTRAKLTLVDIQQLIELCVSECYFYLGQYYLEFT